MKTGDASELILAMCPSSRGLAYVVFEGPLSLIDWAVKDHFRSDVRAALSLQLTKSLVDRYQPETLILHSHRKNAGRLQENARRVEQMLAAYASAQGIECRWYGREDIRKCFQASGARTRFEIAQVIAAHIPALSHRIPPKKKLWQSEDRRMGLFDAASLAMTYYCNAGPVSSDGVAACE